jgi:hypothetical protein
MTMAKMVTSYKQIGRVRHVLMAIPLATTEGEEEEVLTYKVRGLSPKEEFTRDAIMKSVVQPTPPTKKRLPMSLGADKLTASNLTTEEYQDYDDPTYLEQEKQFTDELAIHGQRAFMYRLMIGVQGFDLSDKQIAEALGVDKVHPKEPLESLMLRIDQVCEIILPDADQIHLGKLVHKVMELSGVDFDAVNFTSSSSPLLR